MPRYIVKLKENAYVEWSTIVDAPVSYVLTREHMLAHLDITYGTSSVAENRKRLERTDKHGTSCQSPYSMESLVSCNRAGDKEENISLEEILERYDLKNQEENGDQNG